MTLVTAAPEGSTRSAAGLEQRRLVWSAGHWHRRPGRPWPRTNARRVDCL